MDFKKFVKKLLFPPIWLIAVLVVISAASLVYIFVNKLETSLIAYVIYALAFYTVSVLAVFLAIVLPKRYKQIKSRMYEIPFFNRYLTDATFRTRVSLYTSLLVNLLYVGANVLFFVLYSSYWFVCIAVYYLILVIMRFLLANYVRIKGIGESRLCELKRARLCAYILLTINFSLSGAVLMILYQNKGVEYHGILIYVMAAYTFYITTLAIVNMFRYRKYNSPVMMITKVITLSAALVSMLSLETAMFAQFGAEMAAQNKQLMIMLTGAGVSITVITMSVYMIARTNREIKKLGDKDGEQ
ncbi:MAG: hypothetical protein IJC81_02075 [Clostridia bacterium]|nr:hypothetical protein [Clostridia bacterium]